MGLSKIILPISHTKNFINTYLFIMKKGENMKKLGLIMDQGVIQNLSMDITLLSVIKISQER